MLGQIVAVMFMQFLIERARRISRGLGYSPLILRGGELSSIQISELLDATIARRRLSIARPEFAIEQALLLRAAFSRNRTYWPYRAG